MIQNTDQLDNNNQPLVSIIVITYNSSKYVLETLESAKNQTYQNIELIISDDCSTDDTVATCNNWLLENQSRFVRSKVVEAKKNKGIAPNCNQGLSVSKGEWLKFIAGDDILLTNCIRANVNRIQKQPEIHFLFSKLETFGESKVSTHKIEFWDKMYAKFENLNSAKKQYNFLKNNYNFIPAATSFINRESLEFLKGFDEDIPFLEDYPLWIKATKNGFRMYLQPEILVSYRVSANSVQVNPIFEFSQFLFLHKYIYYNPLYKLFGKKLDGLQVDNKVNKQLVTILKITALPGRVVRKIIKSSIKK